MLGVERITSTVYESWRPTSSPNKSSLPRENVSCTCTMGGRGSYPDLGLPQLCCLPILKLTCWVCGRNPTPMDRRLRQSGHLNPPPKGHQVTPALWDESQMTPCTPLSPGKAPRVRFFSTASRSWRAQRFKFILESLLGLHPASRRPEEQLSSSSDLLATANLAD